MDFPFGTLSTEALKLYHHQLLRQGLHHGYRLTPQRPQAGNPLTLTVTAGVDTPVTAMACYYTTNGAEPSGSRGQADRGQVAQFNLQETTWDDFAWGYTQTWRVTLPGLPADTHLRYRIGGWAEGQAEVFADYPDLKLSAEHAAQRHFQQNLPPDSSLRWGQPSPGTIFSLQIGQAGPPTWASEAIIYHLMIDRFHPGEGNSWRQSRNLNDFCGGNLQGVLDKLDYIVDLGATCVWLSPLWASPSAHGYDTSDYRQVQAQYGNADTLRRLIDTAHERGLRVLFDMACNHLSNQHPIFQQALADSTSSYRDWFIFDESDLGYRSFFGVAAMPEVNLRHPAAREWMIDHARYWVREFDIDGYRLDYASGPRPDFWSYFVSACRAEKPDSFYFGEIVDNPPNLQPYIGRLDGLLDFHLNHALRQTFGWGTLSQAEFDAFLRRHQAYFPADFVMPAFIDNHDMDRFLHISQNNQQAQLAAMRQLFALPNPPVIYYGSEVGLTQTISTAESDLTASRPPMLWGQAQDADLLGQVKELLQDRRQRTADGG